jgi:hypothetical protein
MLWLCTQLLITVIAYVNVCVYAHPGQSDYLTPPCTHTQMYANEPSARLAGWPWWSSDERRMCDEVSS